MRSSSRISTTRQSPGKGRRDRIGGTVVAGPRPPSRTNPPLSNRATPTPERAPRSRISVSAAVSGLRPWRLRNAAANASASCVPEPKPLCAGMAVAISTSTSSGHFKASARRRTSRAARSVSTPRAANCAARRMRTSVGNPSMERPIDPNLRPRSPARSRNPRCSRAVVDTRTPSALTPPPWLGPLLAEPGLCGSLAVAPTRSSGKDTRRSAALVESLRRACERSN